MFSTLIRSHARSRLFSSTRLTGSIASTRRAFTVLPASLSFKSSQLVVPSATPLRSFSGTPTTHLGHSLQSNPPNNSLFVGNLPWSATREELQELFGEFGEVQSVRIHTHEDGRPRGFGHVEFSSKEHAIACFTSAMEEPLYFGGRDLVIDYAKGINSPKEVEPNNRLFFVGCADGEVALKNILAGHAQNIISIYFLRDGNTGARLPRGFVEFKDIDCATEALNELNGVKMSNGEELVLSYARPSRKREINDKPLNPRLGNTNREKYTARSWSTKKNEDDDD